MRTTTLIGFVLLVTIVFSTSGCRTAHADDLYAKTAPPEANVVVVSDSTGFTVTNPSQYPLAPAIERPATSELIVTGAINPDISRNVPVVSLASGRVAGIHARLGDAVQKGQLLMTIRSDDVSGGYSTYRMALADETLAAKQYERAKDLYEHGAIALNDLQVAQDAEEKAKIAVDTAAEHLRLLGNDPEQPKFMVDVFAPTTGVITDQQIVNGSLVQAYNNPAPFTIADLSSVWIICDVYENDLSTVHIGDMADISLNAFPDRILKGKVSNIGTILDPNIRTAKVRIEVPNPGFLRFGMFARATFRGQTREMHTIIPASAILHVHDRDFIYAPLGVGKFRRVEVVSGDLLPENLSLQEVKSGVKAGQQVVTNALVLDHALAQ
jgi:cobalt-zinc-cadmium efflux system membrane fusion protein